MGFNGDDDKGDSNEALMPRFFGAGVGCWPRSEPHRRSPQAAPGPPGKRRISSCRPRLRRSPTLSMPWGRATYCSWPATAGGRNGQERGRWAET
jgi:hypothetical protein